MMVKRGYTGLSKLVRQPLSASELIQQLKTAVEKHGDIPVRVWDEQVGRPEPFFLDGPSDYIRLKYPDLWPCLTIRRVDPSIDYMDLPDDAMDEPDDN